MSLFARKDKQEATSAENPEWNKALSDEAFSFKSREHLCKSMDLQEGDTYYCGICGFSPISSFPHDHE